jgi:hypothetical protein
LRYRPVLFPEVCDMGAGVVVERAHVPRTHLRLVLGLQDEEWKLGGVEVWARDGSGHDALNHQAERRARSRRRGPARGRGAVRPVNSPESPASSHGRILRRPFQGVPPWRFSCNRPSGRGPTADRRPRAKPFPRFALATRLPLYSAAATSVPTPLLAKGEPGCVQAGPFA